MNTESSVTLMHDLKLFGMSKLYQVVAGQPVHQQPEAHTLIGNAYRSRSTTPAGTAHPTVFTFVKAALQQNARSGENSC